MYSGIMEVSNKNIKWLSRLWRNVEFVPTAMPIFSVMIEKSPNDGGSGRSVLSFRPDRNQLRERNGVFHQGPSAI